MYCRQPGFSVHGILQARILEWVTMAFSRGSSQSRDWTLASCIGRQVLYNLCHLGSPKVCIYTNNVKTYVCLIVLSIYLSTSISTKNIFVAYIVFLALITIVTLISSHWKNYIFSTFVAAVVRIVIIFQEASSFTSLLHPGQRSSRSLPFGTCC